MNVHKAINKFAQITKIKSWRYNICGNNALSQSTFCKINTCQSRFCVNGIKRAITAVSGKNQCFILIIYIGELHKMKWDENPSIGQHALKR